MLNNNDIVGRRDQTTDDLGGRQSLSDIEIRRRFVEHVHVCPSHGRNSNGETLQLSTGKLTDFTVQELAQLELRREQITVVQLCLPVKHLSNRHIWHFYTSRDLVDILRFGDSFDVVLEHFGEEVLKLGTSEVFEDFGPFGWVVVSTEIWLELAGEDFESGGFTDTVGSDQTEDLARSWSGQTVEFECVGGVSVGDMGLKIGWQVENLNSLEWAPGGEPASRDDITLS